MEDALFDKIFEFKFMGGQFRKEAKKNEAKQKQLEAKIKSLLQKNDVAGAKLAAQQAICCKKESQRLNALGSKVTAISQKLSSVSKTVALQSKIKNLMNAMPQFNSIEATADAMQSLENFEKMVDNIDVSANMMDNIFDNINMASSNEEEVNQLINAVQQGNAMQMEDGFVDASGNRINMGVQQQNRNMNNMNKNYV